MGCGSFAPSDGADYRLSDIDFILFDDKKTAPYRNGMELFKTLL